MELDQYLSMFIDESKDHLQALNENLLELEKSPQNIAIVQNIFRSAHTLKGMAGTMGFEDLTGLTHEMENVLDLVRNNKAEMSQAIFDMLFRCLDALELMVEDIVQGGTGKADVSELVAALRSVSSPDSSKQISAAEKMSAHDSLVLELDEYQFSVIEQSLELGNQVFHIEVVLQDDCVLKAARSYMVFDLLERNGDIVKSVPSVENIEQEKFTNSFVVYYITNANKEQVEQWIMSISEIERTDVKPIDSHTLKQSKGTDRRETSNSGASAEKETAAARADSSQSQVSVRTIRVEIDRLDTLMNLFSELLIDRVRLEQLASEIKRSDLTETVEHMTRVSGDLQNMVLKMRMVPVDTVFNRFPRMIRDISKSHNKKINLVITGSETELDRTVIDEIGDPLVHLLRNAADHGLETGNDRIAAGKDETGTIHLRAFHSGNHVFIEVEDDGHGISRVKVLNKAVINGLLSRENADMLSDHEVYQLLFSSGFSTAEQISDLSGRGVGLDVVKTKINALGGNVEVDSVPGKGTKFSVQLPLTLSIIAALLVKSGDEKYAIPLSSIVETVSVSRNKINTIHGNKLFDYRNHVIPVVSLRQLFEVPVHNWNVTPDVEMAIIRKGDKLAALEVDAFIGQQDIVLKSLGKYLSQLFAISGATILGDGQVALIVDTNALIK